MRFNVRRTTTAEIGDVVLDGHWVLAEERRITGDGNIRLKLTISRLVDTTETIYGSCSVEKPGYTNSVYGVIFNNTGVAEASLVNLVVDGHTAVALMHLAAARRCEELNAKLAASAEKVSP